MQLTRSNGHQSFFFTVIASLVFAVACGASPESDDLGDGASSAGGAGLTSDGAQPGSGGSEFTSGGASSAGGEGETGGVSTGGAALMSTGGLQDLDSAGGAADEGSGGATDDETNTGGSAAGGTDNESTGGSDGEASMLSAGCGTAPTLTSGEKTIDISGVTREYVLKLPEDYDPNIAYKLIFAWHWLSGEAADVVDGGIIGGPYYGLEERADSSSIFVAPNGIDNGWANTDGRDIAFLHAMLDLFESDLCIDESRLFSTGFSYGGMMSNSIGCEISDLFRAIAPMSGALYSGCDRQTEHPIAVWMAHGTDDEVVPLSDGLTALDVFLEKNGCSDQTTEVSPDPCVAYEGCAEGYPVHYCNFDGGHSPASFAPQAVWDFFNQF